MYFNVNPNIITNYRVDNPLAQHDYDAIMTYSAYTSLPLQPELAPQLLTNDK